MFSLSCPRCIPALLLVSARYPALLCYSPWECVICRLPNVGLFICSALVLALADFPMVLAFADFPLPCSLLPLGVLPAWDFFVVPTWDFSWCLLGTFLFGANAWYFVLLPAFRVAVTVPLRGCASVLRVNDSC